MHQPTHTQTLGQWMPLPAHPPTTHCSGVPTLSRPQALSQWMSERAVLRPAPLPHTRTRTPTHTHTHCVGIPARRRSASGCHSLCTRPPIHTPTFLPPQALSQWMSERAATTTHTHIRTQPRTLLPCAHTAASVPAGAQPVDERARRAADRELPGRLHPRRVRPAAALPPAHRERRLLFGYIVVACSPSTPCTASSSATAGTS
jgi:hypothetical protein